MKNRIFAFIKSIYSYVIIVIVVLLIKYFIVTPIKVNGNSMNDTLYNNDIMILDKISYRFNDIKRFDIVVIKREKDYLIKRIIGLPGDKIEYKNNQLYVNNQFIEENFLHKYTNDYEEDVIPENYYFVLGDNRINSSDSRYIGLINRKDILGKTSLTIFPFNRFGTKK